MNWKIELHPDAERTLQKLDQQVARRIYAFLVLRLGSLDDPRLLGKPLNGPRFGEFWRFRVGDYRIVARIEDDTLRVLVVKVAHRKDVYDR